MNRELLALNAHGNFRIKRRNTGYHPLPVEDNPLMDGWKKNAAVLTAAFGTSITEIYRQGDREIFSNDNIGGSCSGGGACGGD